MFLKSLPLDVIYYDILQYAKYITINKFDKFKHLKKILLKLGNKICIFPNINICKDAIHISSVRNNLISTINIYGCKYLKMISTSHYKYYDFPKLNIKKCKILNISSNFLKRRYCLTTELIYIPKKTNVHTLIITGKQRKLIFLPSTIDCKKLIIKKLVYVIEIPETLSCDKLYIDANQWKSVYVIKEIPNKLNIKNLYIKRNYIKKIPNAEYCYDILNISGHNTISNIPHNFKCKRLELFGMNNVKLLYPSYTYINQLIIYGNNTIRIIPPLLKLNLLFIHGNNTINHIPENLKCKNIYIDGLNTISKIPENLKCDVLNIDGHNTISKIPPHFKCDKLIIWGNNTISEIPDGFRCDKLVIFGNNSISKLPKNLACKYLVIGGKYRKFNILAESRRYENFCILAYYRHIKISVNC
jgi:hypothetical protein